MQATQLFLHTDGQPVAQQKLTWETDRHNELHMAQLLQYVCVQIPDEST